MSPVLAQDNQINEVNKPEIEDLMVLVEFEYTDEDNDGIYTANFQAPPIAGEYEVITVIEYRGDLDTKVLRLTTVIDPEGYVYRVESDGIEARISNSIVFLYWLNPQTNQYDLWPADKFSQENPQITDQTGKYSFLVPEGTYYLRIESDNYHDFQSTEFVVSSGDSVHQNIELKLIRTWQSIIFSWQVLISLLAIVLIVLAVIIIIKLNKFNK